MPAPIVKARAHHGTGSLDVTVPAAICREFSIRQGDAFEVTVRTEGSAVVVIYTRVYKQKSNL